MTDKPTNKSTRRYARAPATSDQASGTDAIAEKTEASSSPKTETKIGKVLTLLSRQEGATLDEMVAATGWQPHTTRAALTGLKKKGHVIERTKRGDITCYCVRAKG
jgi:Fic family protein